MAHQYRLCAEQPRVREVRALLSSLDGSTASWQNNYLICEMLEILARFPQAGPYPAVETIFEQAVYSYIRGLAVKVLESSDPDHFSAGLARECLWDCEDEVREIGCYNVDIAAPGVYERLHGMAHDPHENEEVRNAAAERLRT